MRIAVIGAGINGLAVAVNILESIPHVSVTIFTDKVSPNTTGDVAAGLWKPYAITESDPRMKKWCEVTFKFLTDIIKSDPKHHEYGLFYQDIYDLSNEPIEMSCFHEIVEHSHVMNERELARFPNAKYGIAATTVIVETSKILAHLKQKFLKMGGQIQFQKIECFDKFQSLENFPIVINCTGLASRQLCNDLKLYPVRGQVIRVQAPWIKFTAYKGSNYIIPQSDGIVVLGGTTQANDWNLVPCDNDTKKILEGCKNILCGLENCKILSIDVGLRPRRDLVRLEKEERINSLNGNKYTLIHNYGHGGSGFTLFWGCSVEVVQLVSEAMLRGKL